MDEYGICSHCEAPVSLEQVRVDACMACGKEVRPWKIGFMGDLHDKVDRKVFSWKEFSKK